MQLETGNAVAIRFALPSEALRPFVTTYYCTEVKASESEPVLEDYFHPEWANLRFMEEGWAQSATVGEPLAVSPAFAVSGPTSRATRFRIGTGRSWGIGLLPLGWARLFDAPASDFSDRVADGNALATFANMQPLAAQLAQARGGFAEELALIETHMERLFATRDSDEAGTAAILKMNAELVDPELATVAELADRVAMGVRSLERLSKRAFGFTPKLLLRRQRFLRSLAQFMLDPSLKWLATLDYHYHDQAHFVRDFKRFMGMTPSAYAKLDKPLLVAAARARMAIAGQAMQALHEPATAES